jgi:cold shock protein
VHGRVKWFDPCKGFGFHRFRRHGHDILLHANVLRNFGQGSVADGAGIVVRVQRRSAVCRRSRSLRSNRPKGPLCPGRGGRQLASEMPDLPLEPARVKWFDKGKGFGFANVFGRAEDVFIHARCCASGLCRPATGRGGGLRIVEGKRGRMAVQVLSWEAARGRPDGGRLLWLGLGLPLLAGAGRGRLCPDRVELRWAGGARFAVEVADDRCRTVAQGLMFRESLAGGGMLFVYESPRRAQFWMKNTLIPLDMIFADATGTVTRVHSNAIPHDETPIDGGDGVLAGAGNQRRPGPAAGDRPRGATAPPGVGPAAAWPCEGFSILSFPCKASWSGRSAAW